MRGHWRAGAAALLATMIAITVPATRATPTTYPVGTARLLVLDPTQVVERPVTGSAVDFSQAFFVTTHGGTFEVRVARSSYFAAIAGQGVNVSGQAKALPSGIVHSFFGFTGVVHIHATNTHGIAVADYDMNWCPNTETRVRVNTNGPSTPVYPTSCAASGNPFTRSAVWGIEQGWAVPLADGQISHLTGVPDGQYHVTASWTPAMTAAFGFSVGAVSATVIVHTDGSARRVSGHGPPRSVRRETTAVPVQTSALASTVPNLVALPAWGITTTRANDHDYLTFGATVYDAGPQPLVVEGYRQGTLPIMDAYQYLYAGGVRVARVAVGTMQYDPRPGHRHWHFKDFARYDLLDASKANPVVSGKEAFCLANTDAIDMLVPNAQWRVPEDDLGSVCGNIDSTFIRETLNIGYGDTYDQSRPGQAFDITATPNGTYYIRVTTNPFGHLKETTSADNVSLRKIVLGGIPGHRTVSVIPVGLVTSH